MKRLYIRVLVAIITFSLGVTVAALFIARRHQPVVQPEPITVSQINNSPSKIPEVAPISYPEANSIRSIDFKNFTYPRVGEQRAYIRSKSFTLKNGEYPDHEIEDGMSFGEVVYGDVTGYGNEEAIVILGVQTRGSAIPNCVYIYTFRHNRPVLLWGFLTGDRADGGLKDVYAEDGRLVLELYGKDKIIGRNLYADDGTKQGDCCPTFFTRTRYLWRGGRFIRYGKSDVFPLER